VALPRRLPLASAALTIAGSVLNGFQAASSGPAGPWPPGSRVLLPRNLHRSLLHGCVSCPAPAVLFEPAFASATGLVGNTDAGLAGAVWSRPRSRGGRRLVIPPIRVGRALAGCIALATPELARCWSMRPRGPFRRCGVCQRSCCSSRPCGRGGRGCAVVANKAPAGLGQSAWWLLQGQRSSPKRCGVACSGCRLQPSAPGWLASVEAALCQLHSRAARFQLQRRRLASQRGLRERLEDAELACLVVANQGSAPSVLNNGRLGASNGLVARRLVERAWGDFAELAPTGCLTFCLGQVPPALLESALARQLSRLAACLGGVRAAGFLAAAVIGRVPGWCSRSPELAQVWPGLAF